MLLRRAYTLLVRLHPQRFRQRYGQEMLWIYDESLGSDRARLFADAIVSVLRQRLLRDVHDTLSPSSYSRPAAPVFATIDSLRLPLFTLWQGCAATVLAWIALSILITAGADRRTTRLEFAGVHYLIRSRIQSRVPVRAAGLAPPLPPAGSAAGIPHPSAESDGDGRALSLWTKALSLLGVKRSHEDAAGVDAHWMDSTHWRRTFSLTGSEKSRSVRTVLVLPAVPAARVAADGLFRYLDRNRDGRLSPDEIDHAPEVLRSLDRDGDGKVSAEECGILRVAAVSQQRPAGAFLFGILDQDGDGELSDAEIARASSRLRALARDSDGSVPGVR